MRKRIAIVVLIFTCLLSASPALAALSCIVATSCNSPGVVVLRMSTITNSHAELPSENNYPQMVCCSGVDDLDNSCTDDFGVVLRLSGDTNAHVEENTQTTSTYNGYNACLSVPDGDVEIAYENNDCDGYDTTVVSMATAVTNSHIGNAASYPRKVCASVTVNPDEEEPCSNISCNGGGGGSGGDNDNDDEENTDNPPYNPGAVLLIADFNNDGRVDILDLSILLYYIDQGDHAYSRYDLNKDGVLDFKDVSVLFYYWNVFS